jgi:aminopeptidase N
MENWGMVTYRENAMIYEENYHDISHSQKLSGVNVISHELAHQFFGDLVTMEWWDYIWLNEGFATFFEYHVTDLKFPYWRMRDFFNIRSLQSTFRSDSREQTRPMTNAVLAVPDITASFDGKAGAVLRMFQNLVGDQKFKEALKLYLETK